MTSPRVIVVDWSAAAAPGPATPTADRCWLACDDTPAEYFRTRAACTERLAELLRGDARPTIVGVDFPLGYPPSLEGRAVLPTGRTLVTLVASLLADDDRDANNRFEVAAILNERVRERTGAPAGPFWGTPMGRDLPGVPGRKPAPWDSATGVREFRRVEELLRAAGHNPQPAWKLAYTGSVGSQTLTGLAAIHRLLADQAIAARCRLWPFEHPARRADEILIAEVWPSLADHEAVDHPVKDARQVLALRDALLAVPPELEIDHPAAATEGWILGVSDEPGTAVRSARRSDA